MQSVELLKDENEIVFENLYFCYWFSQYVCSNCSNDRYSKKLPSYFFSPVDFQS